MPPKKATKNQNGDGGGARNKFRSKEEQMAYSRFKRHEKKKQDEKAAKLQARIQRGLSFYVTMIA